MRRHRNLHTGLLPEHLGVTSELVVLFLRVREHRVATRCFVGWNFLLQKIPVLNDFSTFEDICPIWHTRIVLDVTRIPIFCDDRGVFPHKKSCHSVEHNFLVALCESTRN